MLFLVAVGIPLGVKILVGVAWAAFLLSIFAVVMWWDNFR